MHCRIAQIAIERAKRLVESGEHVFMLMDSITRLARAFNNATSKGGPTGTGGLTVRALEMPRKLFAAARNTRDAGSLTIIATALVETNSAMDDRIFEELKGTGNMELVLDRAIAERERRGFVKVLTKPGSDKILGVTIVSAHAGETIAEFVLAMKHGLGLRKILATIHIYPTWSEMNKFTAGAWQKARKPEWLMPWLTRYHRFRRGD